MLLTKSTSTSLGSFVRLRFGLRSTVLKSPIRYSMFAEQVTLTVWLGGEEWLTLRTRVWLLTCEINAQNCNTLKSETKQFSSHYSSLQCHIIWFHIITSHADLLLDKYFLLYSMLKTVVLLNIFVEGLMQFFRILWKIQRVQMNRI